MKGLKAICRRSTFVVPGLAGHAPSMEGLATCALNLQKPKVSELRPVKRVGVLEVDVDYLAPNGYSDLTAGEGISMRDIVSPALTVLDFRIYKALQVIHDQRYRCRMIGRRHRML